MQLPSESLRSLLPDDRSGQRNAALNRFVELGLPTSAQERWKYTNLRSLPAILADSAPPTAPVDSAQLQDKLLFDERSVDRLVLVDGHIDATLSTPGTEFAGDAGAFRDAIASDSLDHLNLALSRSGLQLRLAAGQRRQKPIYLVIVSSADSPGVSAARNQLVLESKAEAVLIEHHISSGDAPGLSSVISDFQLADSACLDYIRIQEEAPARHHLAGLRWNLAADACATQVHLDLGARLSRVDCDVDLAGRGAQAHYHASAVLSGRSHCDHHLSMNHLAPQAVSRIQARGIAAGRARNVFNGRIHVAAGAQGTDSDQLLRNMLLSPHAEADCKPELEIYADDVKCAHGATIGRLDETALFYLLSRGLPAEQARRLLIMSFAEEVLVSVRDDALRLRLKERIEARIHEATA